MQTLGFASESVKFPGHIQGSGKGWNTKVHVYQYGMPCNFFVLNYQRSTTYYALGIITTRNTTRSLALKHCLLSYSVCVCVCVCILDEKK